MAGAAGAAVAATVQAIKASGVIVRVEPAEFRNLLNRGHEGLVVHARGGFFSRDHRYLMGYRGLAFYTSASEPISLPGTYQVVEAKSIWVPG